MTHRDGLHHVVRMHEMDEANDQAWFDWLIACYARLLEWDAQRQQDERDLNTLEAGRIKTQWSNAGPHIQNCDEVTYD